MFVAHCFWAQLFITVYARHDAEDVVIYRVYTDLGCGSASDRSGRENELENSVINTREVARSRGLVLLRAKGE